MALSNAQLKDVCLLYQGADECRYLDEEHDDKKHSVHVCKKLCGDKKVIDQEITLFMLERQKDQMDPRSFNVALGDNCPGYLKLCNVKQGYDVKD